MARRRKKKEKEFAQLAGAPTVPPKPDDAIRIEVEEPTPEPTPTKDETQIFTDPETGKPSGITIDGRTFLGIGEKEIDKLIRQKEEKEPRPSEVLTKRLEEERFKPEDVERLKGEVAVEEAGLPESIIQERERVREEEETERKEEFIERNVKAGMTRKQAELYYESTNPEMAFTLKQTQGDKAIGALRSIFGDVGRDLIGLSLNQFLDQAGDPTELTALQGQMSEAASLLPAIEGVVNNEAITPQRALAELNSAERDGEILRGNFDRLAVLRPEIVQTQEYIEMRVELEVYIADIRDARGTALEKLRTTVPEYNVLETQEYIGQLERR